MRVSSKFDFYDPEQHFSSVEPHLPLRNLGLMRALLALSARHLFLHADSQEVTGIGNGQVDRSLAVQY